MNYFVGFLFYYQIYVINGVYKGSKIMKLRKALPLLSVAVLSLTSCGGVKPWATHLEDYVFEMPYHDGFNILQLTDIHWNYNTSAKSNKQYLQKVIAEAEHHIKEEIDPAGKIDLVEITGDQFMLANSYHVKKFIEFFDAQAKKYGFKYAVIWGNHDSHGLYNPNWLSKQFKKAKYAIYADENDDLYGRSNFVINLTQSGDIKWQLVNLDSGASISDSAVSPFRDYDYIRKEQTDWWLKEHKDGVPSIAYYHIPQSENQKMWKKAESGELAPSEYKYFKLEGFGSNETIASDFIDRAKEHDLKAAFMGHAHNNDWTFNYDGVVIGLGVKTGPELYYAHVDANDKDPMVQAALTQLGITENFDLIGASLVNLKDPYGSFGLQHLYYNERDTGDFIKWAAW